MEIKIPRKEHLRIKHLPLILDPRIGMEFPDGEWIVEAIHIATGFEKWKPRTIPVNDIIEMYWIIVGEVAKCKIDGKPKQEITIAGVEYTLIDPQKAPIGWHADCSNSDLEKDKVRIACLCYIPKGTVYGQMDARKNLLHPIRERYEAFEKEFPLEDFVNLHAFFLKKFDGLMRQYTANLKKMQRRTRWRNRINGLGWKRSTNSANTTE